MILRGLPMGIKLSHGAGLPSTTAGKLLQYDSYVREAWVVSIYAP